MSGTVRPIGTSPSTAGASDIPLNETGRGQADATGRALAGGRFHALYASPLSRAYETGRIIAGHLGLGDPLPLPAVVERDYGEAEGLTGEQILERWPEDAPVPGRETREEVVARTLPALLQLGERHPGESILVVSHGGVIGSLAHHLTDHAVPGPGEFIANGSVHRFVYEDGTLTLDRFNLGLEDRDLFTASAM
ncbi:phosphoglycerate mutase [Leifsonia xyli subsp. cynodontis DSM 46306]|uniref:Histidine phosphatase family protein n=1 Tax=Leifsonia xyli subsp. cynodontis DSM 46306 TaxID=1389489 RepID=U3P6H3_LEIXC|nr:histidine phosphatase family protein [Leifsonia xyli]AGW41376.1 phosphoglycerate mutase [Leifsonia xyli subsp. cynodontis DSM 46306]